MTTKHANGRTYVRQTFEEAVAALHSRCVRDEETGSHSRRGAASA